MALPLPPSRFVFPNPNQAADADGLVAVGADLAPSTLLAAYRRGIFPWFGEGDPIMWWSPDPRCIIRPPDFRPAKSLLRTARKALYRLSVDRDFAQVITQCAGPRAYSDATWITRDIQRGYLGLHQAGHAHSIEVWEKDTLVGGLYGVQLGQIFCGESMFSHRSDVSKLAFWLLMRLCQGLGIGLVDCQLPNEHLMRLGAVTMPRPDFLAALTTWLAQPAPDWQPLVDRPVDSAVLACAPDPTALIAAILLQPQGAGTA